MLNSVINIDLHIHSAASGYKDGAVVSNSDISHLDVLFAKLEENDINLGIITGPVEHAQEACDALVAGGVLGIWNFAPAYLRVPDNILLQNENMAASLALLSKHLREKFAEESER